MTDLRARFEQVLEKHFVPVWIRSGLGQKLLDALVAAVPTVTREQVDKIIQRWVKEPTFSSKDITDALHALLTGAGETKWCEHWVLFDGKWMARIGRIGSRGPTGYSMEAELPWDICPVAGCHAPRPAGA